MQSLIGNYDRKHNSDTKKKRKINKRNNDSIYNTRAEMILDSLNDELLSVWYTTEKEKMKFVKWILEEDEKDSERIFKDTLSDENKKRALAKIKPANTLDDLVKQLRKIRKLETKKKSNSQLLKEIDRGLAKFMDPNFHRKTFKNRDEYRKELKKISKAHREEEKYSINDFEKQLKRGNVDMMDIILSDEYIIKHYV